VVEPEFSACRRVRHRVFARRLFPLHQIAAQDADPEHQDGPQWRGRCFRHTHVPCTLIGRFSFYFQGIFFTYKPVGGEFSPPVPRTSRKQCKFQSGVTMYKGACGTNICLELPESCLEYDVVQHEVHAIDNFAPPVKFPRKIRCFVPPVLDYAPLSLSLRS